MQGGYDLNTLLSGGGITSQYNSMYTWGNGPDGMSFGGAVQLNPNVNQSLAMQLAWDIDHTNVKTGKLWWRDSIYKNSTHTWGEWHLIYDDTTLTKAVVAGLLDDGNGTYVKLNPGSAEQTISSNISSLEKGVVNLWRKSGDHFTFLGFSNGTTETYLGGIGFKSQSDHNLYRKDGSNYYKIWDASNANLSTVDWACKDLSAAGNVTLANNKLIRWMSNPAAGASPEVITAIEFTTGNNLYIGYGVAVSGHNTRLYGNTIDFLTGSATRTAAFVLSDSNATMYRTFVPSINNRYDLGSSELKWGTLHANNGNFYSKVNVGAPSFSDGALNVNGAIVSSGDLSVTGTATARRLIISSNTGEAHIAFSRGGYNYITTPASGVLNIVTGGRSLSLANSTAVFTDTDIRPGANATYSLGTGSYCWEGIYGRYLELKKNGGASLVFRGTTTLNNQVHTILFKGGTDTDSNGFKMETVPATSYGRQGLGFYTSDVHSGSAPYTPDWKRSMFISHNGNVYVGASDYANQLVVYGTATIGTATAASGAALTVNGVIASTGDQVITSDIRVKKNLVPIELTVEQIASCRAVTFD